MKDIPLIASERDDEVVLAHQPTRERGGSDRRTLVLGLERAEDGGDGRAPGRLPWQDEERVTSGVDLELVSLAEHVRDVVLGLSGLSLGPRVVRRGGGGGR